MIYKKTVHYREHNSWVDELRETDNASEIHRISQLLEKALDELERITAVIPIVDDARLQLIKFTEKANSS